MGVPAVSGVDSTQVRNVLNAPEQQGYSYLLNEPIKDEVSFQGNHKEDGKKHTFGKVVGWTLGAAALIATLSLGATHGFKHKLIKGNEGIGKTIRSFLFKDVDVCAIGKQMEDGTYKYASCITAKGDKNIARKAIWGIDRGFCKGLNWCTEKAYPGIRDFFKMG